MDQISFNLDVERLEAAILATIEAFFAARGIPFDAAGLADGGVDLNDLARIAHFHGAEVFPITQPAVATAC